MCYIAIFACIGAGVDVVRACLIVTISVFHFLNFAMGLVAIFVGLFLFISLSIFLWRNQ